MPHSVALIDDHHLVRSGLSLMINEFEEYNVTIQAAHGQEFIDMLKHLSSPDIAVVDLHMQVMDGFETISWIVQHQPNILPLALTFDATDDAMARAIRCGARGFILKKANREKFKTALDSLMLTGYYQDEMSHRRMVSDPDLLTSDERKRNEIASRITPREMEFLVNVCSSSEPTYMQIAESMGVHHRTVDNYRISLFEKFGIKSKAGLVLFAFQHGLVDVSFNSASETR